MDRIVNMNESLGGWESSRHLSAPSGSSASLRTGPLCAWLGENPHHFGEVNVSSRFRDFNAQSAGSKADRHGGRVWVEERFSPYSTQEAEQRDQGGSRRGDKSTQVLPTMSRLPPRLPHTKPTVAPLYPVTFSEPTEEGMGLLEDMCEPLQLELL